MKVWRIHPYTYERACTHIHTCTRTCTHTHTHTHTHARTRTRTHTHTHTTHTHAQTHTADCGVPSLSHTSSTSVTLNYGFTLEGSTLTFGCKEGFAPSDVLTVQQPAIQMDHGFQIQLATYALQVNSWKQIWWPICGAIVLCSTWDVSIKDLQIKDTSLHRLSYLF